MADRLFRIFRALWLAVRIYTFPWHRTDDPFDAIGARLAWQVAWSIWRDPAPRGPEVGDADQS